MTIARRYQSLARVGRADIVALEAVIRRTILRLLSAFVSVHIGHIGDLDVA